MRSTAMTDIVWSGELDGRYLCRVRRTEPYGGVLEILEGGTVLAHWPVELAYDAVFGPDIGDVAEWQERCSHWADNGS